MREIVAGTCYHRGYIRARTSTYHPNMRRSITWTGGSGDHGRFAVPPPPLYAVVLVVSVINTVVAVDVQLVVRSSSIPGINYERSEYFIFLIRDKGPKI